MSTLEVNKITPQGVATEVTLGDSGDTFTIPSGVTLTNNGTANFGKIGQVVQSTSTTATFTTSTSYVSTTFSGTITPSATSSKIFGMLQCRPYASASGTEVFFRITGGGRTQWEGYTIYSGAGSIAQNMTITFEDVPNSTSSVTYVLNIRSGNGNNVAVQPNGPGDGTGRITLMEVLA